MTLEKIYDDIGGLSWFQYRILVIMTSIKGLVGWSMMMMAFAGLVPDFDCLPDLESMDGEHGRAHLDDHFLSSNESLNSCSMNSSTCAHYVFHGSASSVISEWGLVCDLKWVKPIITSIQMAGVLVGALLSGQLSDLFGRRYTMYGFFLLHTVLNVIAGFSVSWQMFIVMRFFIGLCIGALLVIVVPYLTEFLPVRHRPLLTAVPMWAIGCVLFAVAAWLFKAWDMLHFGCALLSVPALLTFIFMPESPRWLAVNGKIKKAQSVLEKIASVNGRSLPPYTSGLLEEISVEASTSRANGRKYSYLDIFSSVSMTKITVIFGIHWCAISIIFYGLSFGVASFSGNLYLNIALMALVEIPANVATYFLANKLGRRLTTFGYFLIGCIAALACTAVHYSASGGDKGSIISALSLVAKMSISGCWGAIATWTVEIYPTVTRGVGYGFVNMTARIGGILAPFALDLDNNFGVSYIVLGVLQLVCLLLTFFVPETKGQVLADCGAQNGNSAPPSARHTNGHTEKGSLSGSGCEGLERLENGKAYDTDENETVQL